MRRADLIGHDCSDTASNCLVLTFHLCWRCVNPHFRWNAHICTLITSVCLSVYLSTQCSNPVEVEAGVWLLIAMVTALGSIIAFVQQWAANRAFTSVCCSRPDSEHRKEKHWPALTADKSHAIGQTSQLLHGAVLCSNPWWLCLLHGNREKENNKTCWNNKTCFHVTRIFSHHCSGCHTPANL